MELNAIYNNSVEILRKNKIPQPQLDAMVIISSILKKPKEYIFSNPEHKLTLKELLKIKKMILRRTKSEPVAYITEEREFYSINFKIKKGVFIPRPETEFIIDEVLELNLPKPNILDIGTGCGNIAITIKKLKPHYNITAVDISKKAINIAKTNMMNILGSNCIKFICADFNKLKTNEKFDLILSNPPYISKSETKYLQKEIKIYEPKISYLALKNGLGFYFKIINCLDKLASKKGIVVFEIAPKNCKKLISFLKKKKYTNIKVKNDLQGLPRVISFMLSY